MTYWSPRYSHSQVWSWAEVKFLKKYFQTKIFLWSLSLHFMASVPCAVGLISTSWFSKEVVGMGHVPLGVSLHAVMQFVTHLRRQDIFFYLSVCHKSSCPGMLSCYYSLCQKVDVGLILSWREAELRLVGFWKALKWGVAVPALQYLFS